MATDKLAYLLHHDEDDKYQYNDPYQQALLQRLIKTKSREEARAIIQGHFPEGLEASEAFLKTKEGPPVQPYVPGFKLLPWHLPREVHNWFEGALSSINGTKGGRPSSLVLWAASFWEDDVRFNVWSSRSHDRPLGCG